MIIELLEQISLEPWVDNLWEETLELYELEKDFEEIDPQLYN